MRARCRLKGWMVPTALAGWPAVAWAHPDVTSRAGSVAYLVSAGITIAIVVAGIAAHRVLQRGRFSGRRK